MKFVLTIKDKLSVFSKDPINQIAFIIFIAQGLFLLYRIFPSIRDINLWDEADYINAGRLFAQGNLTNIEWNPFVSIVYALAYQLFKNSPYWLIQSAAFGRIIIFILLWWGSFLLAKRLQRYFHPLIMVGILFSTNVFADIFDNSSDALFAAMSGLALWQLLSYYEERRVKQLAWTSFFLGLAALTRNDGIVVFVIFLAVSALFTTKSEHKIKHLLASTLPFFALILGYLLIYYLVVGHLIVGTRERTYVAFQQGHLQVYQRDDSCQLSITRCAVLEAQQLYGTPQENNFSVFMAIQRNPQAFWERVKHTGERLPQMIYLAYGKRQGYAFFLLALLGMYGLIRGKHFGILAILLSWPIYLSVYFVTFFRTGYLQTPYFILFILTAIGVHTLLSSFKNHRLTLVVTTILLGVTAVGLVRGLNYLYFNSIVLLLVVGVNWVLQYHQVGTYSITAVPFLIAGLIFQQYNPPQVTIWGQLPEEKAIVLMQEKLPENTFVATGAPGIPHAAKMKYYNLADIDSDIDSSQALYEFFIANHIKAIYIDKISLQNKKAWQLITPLIGEKYEQIFQDEDIRLLLIKP